MQGIIRDLKQFITKNYGKRCPDYNPFCGTCIMWDAYDTIKEGAEFCEDKSRRKNKK